MQRIVELCKFVCGRFVKEAFNAEKLQRHHDRTPCLVHFNVK
jgi:hypothetical protein